MNYKKIHDSIIQKAKDRKSLSGYTEKHHIIPKCMGGSNDKDNLIELTAREHFIVHKLLCEIYPYNQSLKSALYLMSTYGRYSVSAREYEVLRKNLVQSISGKNSSRYGMGGSLNAFYGKKHTAKSKQKMSKSTIKWHRNNVHPMNGVSGSAHPKYGKSNYDIWVDEYGKEKANKLLNETGDKISRAKSGKENLKIRGKNHYNSKKVIHIPSGKVFDTGKNAADVFDVTRQCVSRHCNNKVKNKLFEFYINDTG